MAKYQKYAEYKDSGVEWLGEIPSHWKLTRLKFLAKIKNGQDYKHVETETGFPVMGSGGQFTYSSTFMFDKPSVLLGRKGTIDKPLYIDEPFWTVDTMYYTEVQKEINVKYFYYLSKTILFNRYSTNTALPSMTQENLNNFEFSVPTTLVEINKIANFLDHETAKIDSLIEKQQQLIQLLKEKRQAVISHAVTEGLNPNVPMKDSGVEWLGRVPEHWNITTVRNLIRSGELVLQDGNHGELHPTANDYVEAGIPFLMANNVRNGNLMMGDVKRISKQLADKLRIGFAKASDMLLTHKGTVGEVALVPLDIKEDYWMLTPQVTYYRWLGKKFFNKYFYYQFQSFSIQSQLEIIGGKQSTRAYVGLIAQGDLVVAIPPINEQLGIASNILEKDKSYQLMIYKAESAIQLMQERRTALISAAVTGKIDVRNWQNPNKNNEMNMESSA